MAINKELYERYKKLKAEGVNITLAELKSQMEEEQNNSQTQTMSAPNNNLVKDIEKSQPTWTTSYSNIQTQKPIETNPTPYQGNFTTPIIQNEQKDKKFGLLGYPLGHSLSTYIHNAGFKSLGFNYTYELLETPPENLVDRIKFLKSNNYAGFNVTIPLKLPVTMFLNEIDTSADIIGAVNTVVINPDKTMKGYNTDVIGFRNAIPSDFSLVGKIAGVLGTGGAARAAITALATSGVKQIKIYTRSIPNSIELLKFLRSKFSTVEFNAFQIEYIRDLSDINILVNCTPIGMQGRSADMTPVEENELRTLPEGALVYDVIYNPKKTRLLKLAQKNGYKTINGVDMFIYQAIEAEKIWTGQTPDFKDMKIAALENL
ncbi:shikimate dehydrogenase [bacterium]|nr:shikimate dehydrogenase [bacterium]